jgi:hypothetical protein
MSQRAWRCDMFEFEGDGSCFRHVNPDRQELLISHGFKDDDRGLCIRIQHEGFNPCLNGVGLLRGVEPDRQQKDQRNRKSLARFLQPLRRNWPPRSSYLGFEFNVPFLTGHWG